MENIFCLESHIHLCSRHTSAIPAYVIKTCVTWHAISGTRYWGFVSPKLHVSTYRNQQHCWWFHNCWPCVKDLPNADEFPLQRAITKYNLERVSMPWSYHQIWQLSFISSLITRWHICVSELSHNLRKWFAFCSVPSHYLVQCWNCYNISGRCHMCVKASRFNDNPTVCSTGCPV